MNAYLIHISPAPKVRNKYLQLDGIMFLPKPPKQEIRNQQADDLKLNKQSQKKPDSSSVRNTHKYHLSIQFFEHHKVSQQTKKGLIEVLQYIYQLGKVGKPYGLNHECQA